MGDFQLVDPKGWEYDLHSVYSAYIGHFQIHHIAWYEKSWGHLFFTFEEFLAFSWPAIVVTDARTGKAHIVTRLTSIGAFLKMIKTRFGETLPQAANMVIIQPFETTTRHLRHVSDNATYRKLYNTLPAAVLNAQKQRIRNGEPNFIQEIWGKQDKTFIAIDFEWNERNEKSTLEWGYAAVRCGPLKSLGVWPPVPDDNYRKGHYVVHEYIDKVVNKYCPTYPWHYAFGDSQVISKALLPQLIQAIISSLASPDSETLPNNLVLVTHGANGDLARLEEMKIKVPHNMLVIDTGVLERSLYNEGLRPLMVDPKTNQQRQPGSTLSLENLLRSFAMSSQSDSIVLPHVQFHNSGNDALMCLFALQMLLDRTGVRVPTPKRSNKNYNYSRGINTGLGLTTPMTTPSLMNTQTPWVGYSTVGGLLTPNGTPGQRTSVYDLSSEFGQMRMGSGEDSAPRSPGSRLTPGSGSARNSRRLSGFRFGDA
ncbi:hypothetical protein J3R30DRAFT_3488559 [Lentinula aciculospora]|uniref:Gfd2/YDR514C-like C-terminal domain-containing protein n=1 Tax=Lentinula aciculospora TaxID=153920 RepID=A0A9W9DM02_9AGAR|nr:hypothetical protein J3R30DRAFT_3488559 [Lentinula aciculospora]